MNDPSDGTPAKPPSGPYPAADPFAGFSRRVPDGDTHARLVCDTCDFIHYDNPKIVVGTVATFGDKFLLARRAIEPRRGYWTLPAGFLELNETPPDGALREAREEAEADIHINALLAVYAVPRISQVQLMYRGTLTTDRIAPGVESEAVGLFTWDEIPWHDLAFPSVHWALHHWREAAGKTDFQPFTNPGNQTGDMMPATRP